MGIRLRRSILVPALLVLPVVSLAACDVQGAPYATRACEETADLVGTPDRGADLVEQRFSDAAGWSARAADLDGSFTHLHDSFVQVYKVLRSGEQGDAAQRSADEALAVVARQCAALGTPVEPHGTSLSEMGLDGLVNHR